MQFTLSALAVVVAAAEPTTILEALLAAGVAVARIVLNTSPYRPQRHTHMQLVLPVLAVSAETDQAEETQPLQLAQPL
jgi:hypothetical protein